LDGRAVEDAPGTAAIDERTNCSSVNPSPSNATGQTKLEIEPISAPGRRETTGPSDGRLASRDERYRPGTFPRPGILYIADSIEPALEGRSGSVQAFMRSLAADPEFCEALREGAEVYQPACLIHGDIRPTTGL